MQLFGFVFIHPFPDGNERIHRFLIHPIPAKMGLVQQGVIFQASSSILDKIDEYQMLLQASLKMRQLKLRRTQG